MVLGEPGGGKTRLLSEVARRAAADDVTVLRGATVPSATDPLHPLVQVCRDAGVMLPMDDVTVAPAERRWELAAQLGDALARLGPALLVVDDVQWAPDDTLWVLRRLVDDPASVGWTLLVASRPGQVRSPAREDLERRALRVRLPPLTASEVAELCDPSDPAAPDPAEVITRSGGNPLLVHELLDLGIDADLGDTAADTIGRRLDLAGPDVAGLLSVVAVAGPGAPVAVLADAAGRSRHDVAEGWPGPNGTTSCSGPTPGAGSDTTYWRRSRLPGWTATSGPPSTSHSRGPGDRCRLGTAVWPQPTTSCVRSRRSSLRWRPRRPWPWPRSWWSVASRLSLSGWRPRP